MFSNREKTLPFQVTKLWHEFAITSKNNLCYIFYQESIITNRKQKKEL